MKEFITVKRMKYNWIEWVLTWGLVRINYAYKIDFVLQMEFIAGGNEHSLEWRMNVGHFFGNSHNFNPNAPMPKFYLGELQVLLVGLAEAFIRGQQGGEKLSEDMVLNNVVFTRDRVYGSKRMPVTVAAIDYDQAVQEWRTGRKRLADYLRESILAKQRENAKPGS